MKKSSIDLLMLLTTVASPKQTADLVRDLKALDDSVLGVLLANLEKQKLHALEVFSSALSGELVELQARKSQEVAEKKAKAEANRGTAEEVTHLLLTRNKFRVSEAVHKLSAQLSALGYSQEFQGPQSKSNFTKWVSALCGSVPREKLMVAALNAQRTDTGA